MFSVFYPDRYCTSTYEIDYSALYAKGFRGIVFDIDNTLVPHGAPADPRSRQLFMRLHTMGFRTLVLSNNKEQRVRSFAEAVKATGYIYKAGKPAKAGYRKAMQLLRTKPYNTVFIGDQIFTDVWGAKRVGIHSILVEPVEKWKEEPQIILKRFLEALVIKEYLLVCETDVSGY